MTEKFEKHFKELVKKVEQYLSASIKEENNAQGEIYKAMNYSLLAGAIGCEPSFHVNMFLFSILYSPLSLLLSLLGNYVSRKNEYEADAFARANGLHEALISALKKLSVNSLSNPNPHPAFVFVHYSHPTLVQRIRALR